MHFPKRNQAALVASRALGNVLDETLTVHIIRIELVRTRSVPSNILARRRNGTETWRRRSCQCELIRLNTHEKILPNGDVPRRNGNVTYSVNQPVRLRSEQVWTCNVKRHHRPLLCPSLHSWCFCLEEWCEYLVLCGFLGVLIIVKWRGLRKVS
jgi:hypothetical protein